MSRKQTPSDFLKQIIGRPVVVKLNSGADYRGTVKTSTTCYCMFDILRYLNSWWLQTYFNVLGVLACLDSYMNIALEQTEEYVNGQVINA